MPLNPSETLLKRKQRLNRKPTLRQLISGELQVPTDSEPNLYHIRLFKDILLIERNGVSIYLQGTCIKIENVFGDSRLGLVSLIEIIERNWRKCFI